MFLIVNFLVVSTRQEKHYDDVLWILHYGLVMGILYIFTAIISIDLEDQKLKHATLQKSANK